MARERAARKLNSKAEVRKYFDTLYAAWGPQHWWPAESAFEVVAGAFLTQNTTWKNVEKALANLRSWNVLSLEGIRRLEICELEQLVRPAGYFRQKAARLKAFVAWLDTNYEGSLEQMFARPTEELRTELLMLNGVGPETADSILLYGGQHEVFVVDAYAKRILGRHGLISEEAKYEDVRALVESGLKLEPEEDNGAALPVLPNPTIPEIHKPSVMSESEKSEVARKFNEFHGLLVQVGKHHCLKAAPRCEGCPLERYLPQK